MQSWKLLSHGRIHQLALLSALALGSAACDDAEDIRDSEELNLAIPHGSIEHIDPIGPYEDEDDIDVAEDADLGQFRSLADKQAYMQAEIAAQRAMADCEDAHEFEFEFTPENAHLAPDFDIDDYADHHVCEHGPELTPNEAELAPYTLAEESSGFGYPVGDKTSYPAGGWKVWQVVGHYWSNYGGRHLAQDIARKDGGKATINAPVYAVADGIVRDAQMRSSQYKGVVTIEHVDEQGNKVCSFYAHMNTPLVKKGDVIKRGDQIGTVRDWAKCADNGKSSNTHLHYSIVSGAVCEQALKTKKRTVCSYDKGGNNDIEELEDEPKAYKPINDKCDHHEHGAGIFSPTQFIEDNHFDG